MNSSRKAMATKAEKKNKKPTVQNGLEIKYLSEYVQMLFNVKVLCTKFVTILAEQFRRK